MPVWPLLERVSAGIVAGWRFVMSTHRPVQWMYYFGCETFLLLPEGHGIISAKIAPTVHHTFHPLMLTELDRYGKTTPELFENLNWPNRLAPTTATVVTFLIAANHRCLWTWINSESIAILYSFSISDL